MTPPKNQRVTLVIDRMVFDLLQITPETPLEISSDGKSLTLTPVSDPRRQARFEAALERVNRRYGNALQRLAE
jgi:hypothetical protein